MTGRTGALSCLVVAVLATVEMSGTLSALAKSGSGGEDGRSGNWRNSAQGAPALEKSKKRAADNPKDATAQSDYGWALRQNGDLAAAEAALREAIKLDDKLAYAHSNLSVTLLDEGKKDEALVEAKKAVEIDYKGPIYRVVLGNALAATGDRKGAIDAYKVAIGIRPDYENAFYNLGRVLNEDGQTTEAKTALSEAYNLDSKDDRVVKLLDQLMK
ncbi:MAG TPA: tetratricopeptide repeat protein [Chroococcales cyanobacterium]